MNELALKILDPSGNPIGIQGAGGVPTGGPLATQNIIGTFIAIAIIAAIILCLAMLIWGGINWAMSEGSKEKLDHAKQKIVFAILGLIVILLAFFVVNTIYAIFNIGGGETPCEIPGPGQPPIPC